MQSEIRWALGWSTKRATRLWIAFVNVSDPQQKRLNKREKSAWASKEDRARSEHVVSCLWPRFVALERTSLSSEPVKFYWKNSWCWWNNKTSIRVSGRAFTNCSNYQRRGKRFWVEPKRLTAYFQLEEQVYHRAGTRTHIYWYAGWRSIFQRSSDESLRCYAILLSVPFDVFNSDIRQIWSPKTRIKQ